MVHHYWAHIVILFLASTKYVNDDNDNNEMDNRYVPITITCSEGTYMLSSAWGHSTISYPIMAHAY
jgi:hypothetical protein